MDSMPEIHIKEVDLSKDLSSFIDFPYRLYRRSKFWVPPIKKLEASQFNPDTNSALEHAELKLWVAKKNDKIVGRIGCFINDMESQMRGAKQARFNWFEFEDDPAISQALLDTATRWAKNQNAVKIKGPLGFSNFEGVGMTIDGFEELGSMGAAYHHPYYHEHMKNTDFEKLTDFVEYAIEKLPKTISPKLQRMMPVVEKRFGIRQISIQNREDLIKKAKELFHLIIDTYKGLPTFVPLSEKQIDQYIAQNLNFLLTDYIPLLENQEGKLVGYGVIIPSFSKALRRNRGRLYPFGLLNLLWARRFHKTADLILIGVVDEWRKKGLNALIFGNMVSVFRKKGVKKVRINPILEENQASLTLFKAYDPRVFRRRRVFIKRL